jgi:hypothetical protein
MNINLIIFISPTLAPGTYTLTLDIRSGSAILATSAPDQVVVPALVGCYRD